MSKFLQKNNILLYIFVTVFLVGVLIYDSSLLDYSLTSRFTFFSFSFIFLIVLLFEMIKNRDWFLNWLILSYSAYFVFSGVSVVWSNTVSEALFDWVKIGLGLVVFLSVIQLQQVFIKPIFRLLSKPAVVVTLILGLVFVSQVSKLDVLNKDSSYLITGLHGHKNLFSSILLFILPFCLISVINYNNVWRVFSVVSCLTIFSIVVLLQTRAVWLAMICMFIAFIVFISFRTRFITKKEMVISLGTVIFTMFCVLTVYWEKGDLNQLVNRLNFMNYVNTTGSGRTVIWENTVNCLVKNNLWTGIGVGNWKIEFPSCGKNFYYASDNGYRILQRPHNDYLWVLSESGVFAFLSILIFHVGVFLIGVRSLFKTEDRKEFFEKGILLVGLLGVYIVSLLDFPRERSEHVFVMNVLFACVYVKSKHPKSIITIPQKVTPFIVLIGVLFLVFSTYLGYKRMKGERLTAQIISCRNSGKWEQVKLLSDKAYDPIFFTVDPTSIPLHWYRGNANTSLGNMKEASDNFKLAFKTNPNNPYVINDLASIYVFEQNREDAISLYKDAIMISNGEYDEPKFNLSVVLFQMGETQKAIDWVNKTKESTKKQEYLNTFYNSIK